MVDIVTQIGETEIEQALSIPAQRLIEKLSLLKNRISTAKKRWFWELLQNASDYNETVNVRLTVSDSAVTFSHDGAPFSIRDVLNLISPDSNKRDDELHTDNIGKFGTGLVSTHILSSVMNVEGLCVDKDGKHYSFSFSLDRSCYTEKKALVNQITNSKKYLKENIRECGFTKGFNTSFSYALGQHLPDLPPLTSKDIDLDYLYDVLPYTLCFMPKVCSVVVTDKRGNAKFEEYKIERSKVNNDEIEFSVTTDKESSTQHFAYFQIDDVSSAFKIEDGKVAAFPAGLSRIFCGLPLIGTEDIGMPFLLNSLKFEPTTEREGVELEPSVNEVNRKLFTKSIELYGLILDYIESKKIKDAFNLCHLARKYNGTQASNQQFYNLFLAKYKQKVLSHNIVINAEHQFVSFTGIRLPFNESKADVKLYECCGMLKKDCLPASENYQQWFETTDFSIFTEQKYTYDVFAKEIEAKNNVYSFGKSSNEILPWLYKCAEYFIERDRFIFSKHRLLPNQSGDLCLSDIHADIALPDELKKIYDSLYSGKNCKIEDKLLDRSFNNLNLLNKEFTLEMLAKEIDDELSKQFSNNQGNASAFSSILNSLYKWIEKSDLTKEKLAAYFHWYYPKRATLIVDMLSDTEREQALIIAKSGKMDSLAALASSNLTDDELKFIVANIKKLQGALAIVDEVDDKTFADSDEGERGEEIVYKDLLKKYPRAKGFNVVWASKDRNEPCYDFEITKNDEPFCYCDAETTSRGIANADSIPFFMRKSQWSFLQTLDESTPYIIARVFLGDGGSIKYMQIKRKE